MIEIKNSHLVYVLISSSQILELDSLKFKVHDIPQGLFKDGSKAIDIFLDTNLTSSLNIIITAKS